MKINMKNILFIIALLCVSLFAFNVSASTVPPKPDNGWYVLDQTGKLSSSQLDDLNKKIDNIKKSSKNEMGVLMIPSLNGESIEDLSQSVFRSWGIGDKEANNGVLIVVALAERKSRIHTGKGVEGLLPDLMCNDILRNNLNPHLKKGDFYGGLSETIDVVSSKLNPAPVKAPVATHTPTVTMNGNGSDAAHGLLIVITFVVALSFFLWIFLSSESKRKKEEEKYMLAERLARQRRLESERQEILRRQKENENRIKEQQARNFAIAEQVSRYKESYKDEPKSVAEKNTVRRHDSSNDLPTVPVKVPTRAPAKVINVPKVSPVITNRVDRSATIPSLAGSSYKSTSVPIMTKTSMDSSIEGRRREESRRTEEREEEYRRNREREQREREEEDRRRRRDEEDRRRREEDDRRSSSSSSGSSWSSWDSGSSGGGWGGGDSGGGGSSSDW